MKKFNVNANLLALLMLISLFAGWEYMIIVTAFIWVFCESSKNLKDLTIRAIAIYAGCYLFSWFWDIIYSGYSLAVSGVNGLFEILAGMEVDVVEAVTGINKWVLNPVAVVAKVLDSGVSFLILLAKFKFIVSVITNRPLTGIFGKIQEYINYFVNFANSNLYEDQPVQPNQQNY